MIRLLIGIILVYALYLNFSGSCAVYSQLGCFKSPNLLLVIFAAYLLIGYVYFLKKRFHLFNHRAHYRLKKIKFGFISLIMLLAGFGILIMFGVSTLGK